MDTDYETAPAPDASRPLVNARSVVLWAITAIILMGGQLLILHGALSVLGALLILVLAGVAVRGWYFLHERIGP